MKQTFHGELIEVGSYECGLGMKVKVHGELMVFRMDKVQTEEAGRHLFEAVTITVETGEK